LNREIGIPPDSHIKARALYRALSEKVSAIIGLDKVARSTRPPAYNRAHVLPGQKDAMTTPSLTADQERLIEELRAAIAARDEFIAIAAHELRNPMTPIFGQVQLLLSRARREQVSAALLQGLETLEVAVDHYVRRATTLLEITRLNAEHVHLEPTAFELCDLVRACLRKYEPLATHAGSTLEGDLPGPVDGTWDHLATEQVLDNLVSNAIRYGDGKPVRVELETYPEWVEVRVIDHGIGVAPADRERIFQRFERASGAPRSGGFGIGLWLSSKLVQAQGGSLSLQSEPGQGSTFIARLPRDVTAHAKIE
jgi:two-component system OmpR family sensor kinase